MGRNAVQRHQDRNRSRGLCRYCPKPEAPGHSMCEAHLEKRRNYENGRYAERRDKKTKAGLCLFCSEPGDAGSGAVVLLCIEHREKLRVWALRYYHRTHVPTGRPPGRPRGPGIEEMRKPRIFRNGSARRRVSRPRLSQNYPYINSEDSGSQSGYELLLAINSVVSKEILDPLRAEVCQDMAVAVLDGSLRLDGAAEMVGRFVKEAYRKYPVRYGPLSLEQLREKGFEPSRI